MTLITRAEQARTREEAERVFHDFSVLNRKECTQDFWAFLVKATKEDNDTRALGYLLLAAVAAIPEGWQWSLSNRCPKPFGGRAYIHNGELHTTGVGDKPNPKYRGCESVAHHPCTALLAAIIKAGGEG